LRNAIVNNEFRLLYQPIVNIRDELAPVSLDTTLSTGTEKEWPS
jgi:EAL domain-containing protein (putative c-di-GMP-specific phosphodiesterase class I)